VPVSFPWFIREPTRRRAPMTEDRAHKVADEPAAAGRRRPERYPAPLLPSLALLSVTVIDLRNLVLCPPPSRLRRGLGMPSRWNICASSLGRRGSGISPRRTWSPRRWRLLPWRGCLWWISVLFLALHCPASRHMELLHCQV
jgi:hypothetical protein